MEAGYHANCTPVGSDKGDGAVPDAPVGSDKSDGALPDIPEGSDKGDGAVPDAAERSGQGGGAAPRVPEGGRNFPTTFRELRASPLVGIQQNRPPAASFIR